MRLCDAPREQLYREYGMVAHKKSGCLGFKDNGSNVLGVVHVDTVADTGWWKGGLFDRHKNTRAKKYGFGSKTCIKSIALDDRLGLYILTKLLPSMNVNIDWLLTDNEEVGGSTAYDFVPEKEYNWICGFDRRDLDVVMYQYHDDTWRKPLQKVGMSLARGTYSDITELGYLGVTGFNWGVGYHSEHSSKCYAWRGSIARSANAFASFYEEYRDVNMPYDEPERIVDSFYDPWTTELEAYYMSDIKQYRFEDEEDRFSPVSSDLALESMEECVLCGALFSESDGAYEDDFSFVCDDCFESFGGNISDLLPQRRKPSKRKRYG